MKITLAILALVLAGCSTSAAFDRQQMLDKEPTVVYTTDKPIDEAGECIEAGVRAVSDSGHTVSSADDGEARVIWVTTLANPGVSVRITADGAGSRVEYRSRYKLGYAKFTNAVSACK